MKTTERFDKAVTLLYNAFNEGTLNAMDCNHCAVGNLCGNTSDWDILRTSDIGVLNKQNAACFNNPSDYTPQELITIECLFLYGVKTPKEDHKFENLYCIHELYVSALKIKELQFKGLMAVIQYLAELDDIEVPEIVINDFKNVLQ